MCFLVQRAREELLSVVEQKNREIERLQKALLDIQTHPPAQEDLLSHIQDAINVLYLNAYYFIVVIPVLNHILIAVC